MERILARVWAAGWRLGRVWGGASADWRTENGVDLKLYDLMSVVPSALALPVRLSCDVVSSARRGRGSLPSDQGL